jgi:hypothetical protein
MLYQKLAELLKKHTVEFEANSNLKEAVEAFVSKATTEQEGIFLDFVVGLLNYYGLDITDVLNTNFDSAHHRICIRGIYKADAYKRSVDELTGWFMTVADHKQTSVAAVANTSNSGGLWEMPTDVRSEVSLQIHRQFRLIANRKYQLFDTEIRYIQQANEISSLLVIGEWVMYLDSDQQPLPATDRVLAESVCVYSMVAKDQPGKRVRPQDINILLQSLKQGYLMFPETTEFRKSTTTLLKVPVAPLSETDMRVYASMVGRDVRLVQHLTKPKYLC